MRRRSTPRGVRAQPFTPIFLVSAPRSGSRWLNHILGHHPQIASGRETYIFELIARMYATVDDRARRGRGVIGAGYIDRAGFGRICADLFRALVQSHVHGRKYFVEKTPMNTAFIDLIHEVFPEAKIIHLIRDGRDVVYSMAEKRALGNSRLPETFRGCVMRWRQIENVLRFGCTYPHLYVGIRYEDALRDLDAQLEKLFAALSIPLSKTVLRSLREASREVHHPSAATAEQGYVGKWRRGFSADDLRCFAEIAGDLLIELGYERNRDWARDPDDREVRSG